MIADGIHSLSDLATDVVVLVAAKHGAKDADDEHPYGHGRIETLATVALGIVLDPGGVRVGYDAITSAVRAGAATAAGMLALSAAVISRVGEEGLYHCTAVDRPQPRSNLLRATPGTTATMRSFPTVVVVVFIGGMAGLELS